jgi:hypothetical protein
MHYFCVTIDTINKYYYNHFVVYQIIKKFVTHNEGFHGSQCVHVKMPFECFPCRGKRVHTRIFCCL